VATETLLLGFIFYTPNSIQKLQKKKSVSIEMNQKMHTAEKRWPTTHPQSIPFEPILLSQIY
jgi:hypothetical protein